MQDTRLEKIENLLGSIWVSLDVGSDRYSILKDMENLVPLIDSYLNDLDDERDKKFEALKRFEIESGSIDLVRDCDDVKLIIDEIRDVLKNN